MRLDQTLDPRWGMTIVRLMAAIIVLVSGTLKWVNGIGGQVNFFTSVGIPLPQVMAPVIATGEIVGGLLIAVGLGVRWAGLWFTCQFLVTTFYVKLGHGRPWDDIRIDLMLLVTAISLALVGAGKLALDEYWSRRAAAERRAPLATA
jgi:putative oxidoreductase